MKPHVIKKRLGWHPDHPDHRDLTVEHDSYNLASVPSAVDLSPVMPPVYDQGALGSCVYNAVASALHYREIVKTGLLPRPVPARLFGYYNGRKEQGTVGQDSGSTLRMGCKVAAKYGYCAERLWPYVVKRFTQVPPKAAYTEAKKHELRAMQYARVDQIENPIKATLAMAVPVVFGFTVYESFQHIGADGVCPMPAKTESVLGGHAVTLVGYDDKRGSFLVRNSWGPDWGAHGHFWMPYGYVLSSALAQDFWCITDVPTPDADS